MIQGYACTSSLPVLRSQSIACLGAGNRRSISCMGVGRGWPVSCVRVGRGWPVSCMRIVRSLEHGISIRLARFPQAFIIRLAWVALWPHVVAIILIVGCPDEVDGALILVASPSTSAPTSTSASTSTSSSVGCPRGHNPFTGWSSWLCCAFHQSPPLIQRLLDPRKTPPSPSRLHLSRAPGLSGHSLRLPALHSS